MHASLASASLASKTKIRVNCVVPLFKEENLGIASQVQNSIKLKKFNRNCAIKYIKHIIPASCSLPQVLEDTFTQTLSKAEYLQHIKKWASLSKLQRVTIKKDEQIKQAWNKDCNGYSFLNSCLIR